LLFIKICILFKYNTKVRKNMILKKEHQKIIQLIADAIDNNDLKTLQNLLIDPPFEACKPLILERLFPCIKNADGKKEEIKSNNCVNLLVYKIIESSIIADDPEELKKNLDRLGTYEIQSKDQGELLQLAVQLFCDNETQNYEIIDLLLENGFSPLGIGILPEVTALHIASGASDNGELLNHLVEYCEKADGHEEALQKVFSIPREAGVLLIHSAGSKSIEAALKYTLAPFRADDDDGMTVLHFAAQRKDGEIVLKKIIDYCKYRVKSHKKAFVEGLHECIYNVINDDKTPVKTRIKGLSYIVRASIRASRARWITPRTLLNDKTFTLFNSLTAEEKIEFKSLMDQFISSQITEKNSSKKYVLKGLCDNFKNIFNITPLALSRAKNKIRLGTITGVSVEKKPYENISFGVKGMRV
ncbi:MAG: hypothetical protein AAF621_05975, partial [Pseudomonadota bacterium]